MSKELLISICILLYCQIVISQTSFKPFIGIDAVKIEGQPLDRQSNISNHYVIENNFQIDNISLGLAIEQTILENLRIQYSILISKKDYSFRVQSSIIPVTYIDFYYLNQGIKADLKLTNNLYATLGGHYVQFRNIEYGYGTSMINEDKIIVSSYNMNDELGISLSLLYEFNRLGLSVSYYKGFADTGFTTNFKDKKWSHPIYLSESISFQIAYKIPFLKRLGTFRKNL